MVAKKKAAAGKRVATPRDRNAGAAVTEATPRAKAGSRHVALLRGINVGGNKRIVMKELVKVFETCGCTEVATYIQSGNVVFTTPPAWKVSEAELAARIEKAFGFAVPVVVRTAVELEAAIARNPFPDVDPDEQRMHLSFLATAPTEERIASLDPKRSPGDTFKVMGREIYLLFPNGAGNTKLTSQYLDSRLGTMGTARNWRTVLKLREMCAKAKA